LWQPLKDMLATDKPFLGICLGYQLLFDSSQEAPGIKGLGHFRGSVVRFRFPRQRSLKVPHMGWNTLQMNRKNETSFLRGIHAQNYFYFVHSYYPSPQDARLIATRTVYGKAFASSIARNNLFASQFHPEKSGKQGLRLLRNFVGQLNG
jgi:glutamine amidotransferase